MSDSALPARMATRTGIHARTYLPSPIYDGMFEAVWHPHYGWICQHAPFKGHDNPDYWEPVPAPVGQAEGR